MDYLDTAVRVWAEPHASPRRKTNHDSPHALPSSVLVFDTETTTDASQMLTFGSYRYFRLREQRFLLSLACVEEGLFYADDLEGMNPDGSRLLHRYARTHSASVDAGVPRRLRLLSRREFVKTVFFDEAYRKRSLVVGFNLPFDFSRLAVSWGEARGRFHGGFSLLFWDYEKDGQRKENSFRPRLDIKTIDSKRALKGFTRPMATDAIDRIPEGAQGKGPDDSYIFRGHFLDLRTLVFALTDQSHSLASACEAFGVEHGKLDVERHGEITEDYIDYNRRDVEATTELLVKVLEEYRRHPIDLQPTRAYSPASIGKAYLRAMGIRPRLELQPEFPSKVLGRAMLAYYGGRAECRIRKVPVPVVYLDFLSMYPTVNALMGLWEFHLAERIEVEDCTDEIQEFLAAVSLGDCFRQQTWKRFCVLVEVVPDGDVLPVRAAYQGAVQSFQIGVNPLFAERAWYLLPDLVGSKLLCGLGPRILRAVRLVPKGRQPGLRPIWLRGEVEVDPRKADLFRTAIEQRTRVGTRSELNPEEQTRLDRFLKVLANADAYGIAAEMNRRELPKEVKEEVTVYGLDPPFVTEVGAPEDPGEYCFPPLAACITAGARLMLAMVENCVAELGGTYATCDTDSKAIVATERGGLVPCPGGPVTVGGKQYIRALSWQDVERIRARFATLNPYNPEHLPGFILKLEDENFDEETAARRQLWCYSISAKRYAFFNLSDDGQPILRKWSEHGLGHLLNPTDADAEDRHWIRECWELIVREALGLAAWDPAWLDRPALSRLSVSSPHVLRPFRNAAGQTVRPFNFLLSAQVAPFGHPEGVDPIQFHLVAPWESDPARWGDMPWRDLHSGKEFPITTTDDFGASDRVLVMTYRDVLAAYRVHPEPKSLAADGTPCGRATEGLLGRRPVTPLSISYVGKEANKLEEVEMGLIHNLGKVLTAYGEIRYSWDRLVRPVLRDIPARWLAEKTGLTTRSIQRLRNGHSQPRRDHEKALTAAAAAYARWRLQDSGHEVPAQDLACLQAYLAARGR